MFSIWYAYNRNHIIAINTTTPTCQILMTRPAVCIRQKGTVCLTIKFPLISCNYMACTGVS